MKHPAFQPRYFKTKTHDKKLNDIINYSTAGPEETLIKTVFPHCFTNVDRQKMI